MMETVAAPTATVRPPASMVIACEPSGDVQAGALVHALRERLPELDVLGVGGHALRAEKAHLLYDTSTWGTMGVWQALPRIPGIMVAFQGIKRAMLKAQPDLLVVIDSPAINLPLVSFCRLQRHPHRVLLSPPNGPKIPSAINIFRLSWTMWWWPFASLPIAIGKPGCPRPTSDILWSTCCQRYSWPGWRPGQIPGLAPTVADRASARAAARRR